MKNALIFFYNLEIYDLTKINNEYFFCINDKYYVLKEYTYSHDIVDCIYELNKEMLAKGFTTYEIVLTKDKTILINYNDAFYILMIIPNVRNRIISMNDILRYRYVPDNKMIYKLDRSNWSYLWEFKIDRIEEQFNEIKNKHPIIGDSINYFIGLFENAISYLNNNKPTIVKEVCYRRVSAKTDLLTFINPLNMIVDTKLRDVSEYLKSYVLEEKFTRDIIVNYLDMINLNKNDATVLISRCLFPSYYFDMYENIVMNNKNDDDLKIIISKHKNEGELIKIILEYYSKYSIDIIDWIKKED